MSAPLPSQLAGHAIAIQPEDDLDGMLRRFRLVSSAGEDKFRLHVAGQYFDKYGLYVAGSLPLLLVATAVDTDEQFVVFDGGRHGYDAMFVEHYDAQELDSRQPVQPVAVNGRTEFAVQVEVIDNIDWDDEADGFRNASGNLQKIDGTEISDEQLRADGYDSLAVSVVLDDGTAIEIVSEELA